jgi:hypothetical protein
VELKINWNHKRCKHAIERMWLRGVSMDEVEDAIIKGKKSKQMNTGLVEHSTGSSAWCTTSKY